MFKWLNKLLFGPTYAERESERLVKDWEAEYQAKLRQRELEEYFPAYVTNGPLIRARTSVAYPGYTIAYTEEERLARVRRMEEDARRRQTDSDNDMAGVAMTTILVGAALVGSHSHDNTPSYSPSHDSGSCSSHDSGSSSSGDSGGSCGGGE